MEIGYRINKPVITQEECDAYSKVAEWCNSNDAHIEDKGDYYEVVINPEIEPIEVSPSLTIDELNEVLLTIIDRIDEGEV